MAIDRAELSEQPKIKKKRSIEGLTASSQTNLFENL
jgi:hypothetical protein